MFVFHFFQAATFFPASQKLQKKLHTPLGYPNNMFLEDVLLKYIVAFAVLISLLISGSSAVEWDRRQGNHPPRPRRSRCYYRIDAPPGIGPLNWYRVTVELEGPIWKEKCNRHDFMLPQLTAFNDAFDARSESGSRSNFGGRDFRTYWEKKGQGHCKVMLWTQNIDWIPGFFECFAPEGAGGPTECLPVSPPPLLCSIA